MTTMVHAVNVEHALAHVLDAQGLMDSVQGAEVVQGTAQVAAVAAPLRILERSACLLRLAAAEVENEMLQLRDGWPSDG